MKRLTFSFFIAIAMLATSCQKADQSIDPQVISARKGADDKSGDDRGNHPEPGDDKGGKGGHKEPGDDKGGK